MSVKKYRLLKNLPEYPMGSIFKKIDDDDCYEWLKSMYQSDDGRSNLLITHDIVKNNPDWFEEIVKKTAEEIIANQLCKSCFTDNKYRRTNEVIEELRNAGYEIVKKELSNE